MTARAASAANTRQKIIGAACAVYARVGYRAASIQAIAKHARVSPATVLNHFAGSDPLLAAALEHLTAQLGLPEPDAIRALDGLDRRISAVSRALATCYERGEPLYRVYSRDRDLPVVQAADRAFFRRVDALLRAALGPELRDKRIVTVVQTLAGWQSFQSLRASGMSSVAAADVVAEVVLAWLRSRQRRS
jgi:AcrR family transcriptional regulator